MKGQVKRFIVTMTGLIIALLLLVIWNVTSGSVSVDGMQMWQVLLRQTREGTFYHIVWDIRMPRLLAALFLGGALAVSGFLLQTFFQNPIAGPYVLGISSGAKMLVAVAMILCLERGMQISSLGMVAGVWKEACRYPPLAWWRQPLSAPCLPWALSCSYPCAYRRCRFWSCVVL